MTLAVRSSLWRFAEAQPRTGMSGFIVTRRWPCITWNLANSVLIPEDGGPGALGPEESAERARSWVESTIAHVSPHKFEVPRSSSARFSHVGLSRVSPSLASPPLVAIQQRMEAFAAPWLLTLIGFVLGRCARARVVADRANAAKTLTCFVIFEIVACN